MTVEGMDGKYPTACPKCGRDLTEGTVDTVLTVGGYASLDTDGTLLDAWATQDDIGAALLVSIQCPHCSATVPPIEP